MSLISYHSQHYERTAGAQASQSIQSWKKPAIERSAAPSATADIINNLEKAATGKIGRFDADIEAVMAYAPTQAPTNSATKQDKADGYNFSDVVDVINPLHHLPVVGMVYRGITGDKLHPMSQIIGGALFGGPVGAITGTANAITQIQTGKDIGDHALSMAGLGRDAPTTPAPLMALASSPAEAKPAITIEKISAQDEIINKLDIIAAKTAQNKPLQDLPGTAMAFADLSYIHPAPATKPVGEGRTAGQQIIKSTNNLSNGMNPHHKSALAPISQNFDIQTLEILNPDYNYLPPRQDITSLSLSALPPRQKF